MTLETFFEKFNLFADAPDAVAKMRELVLSLAIQGKLVQTDTADEGVEHLLARNDQTRRATAKSDRRADVENQPLLSAEDRWEIPGSWSWRALADLVLFVDYRGKTPAKLSEGIRLLTAKNVRIGAVNLFPEEFLSEKEYHTWMTRGFPKAGDVLFTTEAPMGSAAVVRLTERFALAQRVICFQSYGAIDSSFLVLQILSTRFQFILDKNGTGVTAKGIKASKLKQLPIAIPPLAEQKRIVAKVDELMALCDRLEAQQQEREAQHAALARAALARFAEAPTPANLDFLFHKSYTISPADLRKSILTLALQGKLVSQDPTDEPAEELLARIARKRTELLKAAYPNRDEASTQLRKQEAQLLPDGLESLAPGWSWATLIQASLLVVDCHNKTAPYVQSGVRLLRTTNIRDGRLNLSEPKFVDDATYERWSARCKPEPGDVLITREAPMGEVCIIPEGMKVCLGQRMMLIRLVPGTMDQKYLLYSLMAPDLMERVQDKPVGATVQHLRVGGVETLLTPVPPLAEQRRIVAKVEQLMALVDALETQLAASRTVAANLLSALVAELTEKRVPVKSVPAVVPVAPALALLPKPVAHRPPNRHFARALLSAEIIHRLHTERTLGRTKHQKIFHVCEHIAQIGEIQGQYHREAAGPLDNKLIYANEAELKKQQWYEEVSRDSFGHEYIPLPKAGGHRVYLERYWPEKLPLIEKIIELMRDWSTERCEIFSTAYAAWNDLLIQGREPTHEAILHEILDCWNDTKKRIPAERWIKAIEWMKKEGWEPKGFGKPTLRRR